MYYFCTYFDKNYLNKGLALYHSLSEQCPEFRLYILCMDDVCHRTLARMSLPDVTLVSREEFEKDDPALRGAKENRSLIEYYFTCTPSLPLYVLNRWPEVDIITYLDSDLFFFRSPAELYEEMGSRSVLIVGHRFPPAIAERNVYGIYNVGYLSFRRDEQGYACLKWWRERCIDWCYDRLDGGRFAEQKYLDDWPERFPNVAVLQHKGGGLSPWNIGGYEITALDSQPLVDGQPLIFYHFHGFRKISRWFYDTELRTYHTGMTPTIARYIYKPYMSALEQGTREAARSDEADKISVAEIRKSSPSNRTWTSAASRFGH